MRRYSGWSSSLIAFVLLEMTLTAFNYFSVGGDYVYHLSMLDPIKAINESILFFEKIFDWGKSISIIIVIILMMVLWIFYYKIAIQLFRSKNKD